MKNPVRPVQSKLPMPRLRCVALSAIQIRCDLAESVSPAELSDLSESIRRHGLLQPIGVRKKRTRPATYELLFGYRRFLACRALSLPNIPCLIFEERRQGAVLSLCENLQRKTPAKTHLSDTAARLGVPAEELAARLPLTDVTKCEKPPKQREFSLFLEEVAPAPERTQKGLVRDVRLVANSIDRAINAGKDAGFPIDSQKIERAREIWYHIRLPRLATGGHATILFPDDFPNAG